MIVISRALSLAPGYAPNATFPVIGWQNVLTPSGITAGNTNPSFPASNLARPSTAERWQALTTDDQYLTFQTGGAEADYVGIARHNLGSGAVIVSVEAETLEAPGEWIEVVEDFMPASDGPILVRFVAGSFSRIRVRLQPDMVVPRIAVVFIGKLLVMERSEMPDVTPIPFAASNDVVRARAQSGDYLGSIVLRQGLKTSIKFQYLSLDWYLAYMQPFVDASLTQPFFYAWSPAEFPDQVGYAWTTADVRPSIDIPRFVEVQLSLEAVKV